MVGAPKNPFVAARKIQKPAETETDNVSVPPEQKEADGPPVAKKPTLETHVMTSSISDANVQCNTSDNEGASSSSGDNEIELSETENSIASVCSELQVNILKQNFYCDMKLATEQTLNVKQIK